MNYILPISLAKYIIFKSLMVRTKKLAITWVAYHGTFVSLKSIKYLILVLLSNFNSISRDCIHILYFIWSSYSLFKLLFWTEDDTSIHTEVKVPILETFHRHIYDREWHFSCELQIFFFSVLIVFLTLLVFSF